MLLLDNEQFKCVGFYSVTAGLKTENCEQLNSDCLTVKNVNVWAVLLFECWTVKKEIHGLFFYVSAGMSECVVCCSAASELNTSQNH